MKYLSASATTTGLRQVNQDRSSEFTINGVKIMLLCDGNGGKGGEVIADCAARFLSGEIVYGLSRMEKVTLRKLIQLGRNAIKHTTEDIDNLKFLCQNLNSCGTTLTLVLIYKATVITFWVGDSPCLLYCPSQLSSLACPSHTLAEMLISQGEDREKIEKQTSLASTLTRCIGFKDATPSVNVKVCKPPFSVAIASDGIDCIPKEKIGDIFAKTHLTECLPDKIIISALEHGSSDNITVVATKVKEYPRSKMRRKLILHKKRRRLGYV